MTILMNILGKYKRGFMMKNIKKLKIALINALEYIQEITNYDMHEVEALLGLKVNTYLELINEDL